MLFSDDTVRDGTGRGIKPSMNVDVNGNPLDTKHNTQMREKQQSNEVISGARGPRQFYSIPNQHDLCSSVGGSSHTDTPGKAKSEDGTGSAGSNSISSERTGRKGHKKARKTEVTVVPENYPGYVGDKLGLDSLVKYITKSISPKELKKLSQGDSGAVGIANISSSSSASTIAFNSGKGPKNKKDRSKTKQSVTSRSSENQDTSVNFSESKNGLSSSGKSSEPCASDASILTVSIDSHCGESESIREVSSDVEEVAGEMGNSSTSEKPRDQDGFISQDGNDAETVESAVVAIKNNHLSKKQVSTTAPLIPKTAIEDAKVDDIKNHKNHALNNSIKSCPVTKQELISISKDSKDRTKLKSVPKDTIRSDGLSVHSTDNSNKKAKTKVLNKSESKSEIVSESMISKLATSEGKDIKEDKEACKAKTAQNALPVVAVALKHDADSLDMDGESFIFTDVDLPHKEQEFTVVSGKKKKRSPFQGQGQISMYQSRESQQTPYFVAITPNTRSGSREIHNRPQFPKARSCTPPPYPYPTIAVRESSEPSCDLSPSAFPVLRKSAKTGPKVGLHIKEHRRRSLEDLSLDTGQLLGYESDRESVKSLPASKGSACGRILAYPVSYASKAATPRPSVDSSKAESVSSSTEGGGSSEWHSPVVWKGNLQERRHSIGSSPEDCSKVAAGSDLQSSRPKSGSQELLPRDSGNSPDRNARICLLPGSKSGVHESASSSSFMDAASALSDVDSAQGGSEVGSDPAGDVFVPPTTLASHTVGLMAEDKVRASSLVSRMSTIPVGDVAQQTAVITASRAITPQTNSVTTSTTSGAANTTVVTTGPSTAQTKCQQQVPGPRSQVSSSVPSLQCDVPVKAAVPMGKGVNNGRKSKNSVVFLDKRFLKPTNLGISFGFDINLVTSNIIQQSMPDSSSSSASGASLSSSSSLLVGDVSPAFDNSFVVSASDAKDKVPSASEECLPTSLSPTSTAGTASSADDINRSSTKPAKGPHIPGLNGLVVRQCTEAIAPAEHSSPAASSFQTSFVTGDDNTSRVRSTLSQSGESEVTVSMTPEVGNSPVPPEMPVLNESVLAKPRTAPAEGCVTFRYGEGLKEVSQVHFPGKVRESSFFMCKAQEPSSSFNFVDAASYFQKGKHFMTWM